MSLKKRENELQAKFLLRRYQMLNTSLYASIIVAIASIALSTLFTLSSSWSLEWTFNSSFKALSLTLYFLAPISMLTAVLASILIPSKLKALESRYEELSGESFQKGLDRLYEVRD